jgi:Tol biopolymer transport system component
MQVADIPAARDQLGKILSSAVFAKSPRMSRFLRYVVEQTLEGRGDRIKEYAIGVEVFDKGEDYDPQADSTVRTEATKLRARLNRYYETDGAGDPIVITIPKGTYAPLVEDRRRIAPARRAAPRARVMVASGLVVAVAIAAGLYWTKEPEKAGVAPKLVPLTSFPELEEHPTLSPDGSRVAFAWKGDIYVREIDGDGLVQITHDPAPETWPSWSPNGRLIAFVRAGSAFVVSPLGGGEQRVTEAAGRPVWTPDSLSIVVPQDSSSHARSIFLVSLASGEKRRLTFPHNQSTGDVYAAVSPDGERIAFHRVVIQGGDIYVASLKGGDEVQLTSDHRPIFGLTWTPDGREIVFSSRRTVWDRLWRIPAGATRGGSFPQPVPVEGAGDDAWFPTITGANAPRPSRLVYERHTRNFDIRRAQITFPSEPRVGVSEPFITSSSRVDVTPAFSPDGSKVAFVSDRSGSRELWIANSDGTRPMQLTAFGGADVIYPRWSPDSRQLIFGALTGPEANFEGYTLEVGTRGPKRLSAGESPSIAHPIFSRDGQSIIFIAGALAKKPQIYWMPLSGGKPVQITTGGAFRPEESPDGKLLYYSKLGQPGLWAVPAQGGEERQVLDSTVSEKNRNWTVAKHGVYFFDFQVPPGAPKLVKFYSFKSGKILGAGTVEPTASVDFSGISVSPDGRWLLYSHIASVSSDLVLLDHFR